MARKVFMSVLGTGFYYPCVYQGRKSSTETRFIQEATLKEVGADQWSENDCVYILLTQEARKKNWDKNITERSRDNNSPLEPYSGLELALENLKLPCQVKDENISDGKNESEMWDIFEKVYAILEEGDELYFDLTHAFRYLPMLLLVLGNYAKFLQKTQVVYMSYGNYEAREKNEKEPDKSIAPIVDLLPLAVLQDWTSSAFSFTEMGKVKTLTQSMKLLSLPILNSDLSILIDELCLHLNRFEDQIETCRCEEIIAGGEVQQAKALIKKAAKLAQKENSISLPTPLLNILFEIQKKISPFQQNSLNNVCVALQWCKDYSLVQQGYTLCQEGIITYVCTKLSPTNPGLKPRKFRELWSSIFALKDETVADETRWKNLLDEKHDYAKAAFSLQWVREFRALYRDLTDGRNNLNHAGYSGKKKTDEIISDFLSIVNKCMSIFEMELTPPQLPDVSPLAPIFINYSNHPSEKWPQAQLEAANEFGPVVDIPFRSIDPEADSAQIKKAVEEEAENIRAKAEGKKAVVHIMGEMTLTYALVRKLKEAGIRCVASTTSRVCCENADGSKTSQFNFVKFRDYE